MAFLRRMTDALPMPLIEAASLSPIWGWMVALGLGLLIGLERERHKGVGPDREAAGVRSFSIASLGGALSMSLATALEAPAVLVAASLVAGAFALSAYRRTQGKDPGLTTELSLFVTFLLGAMALRDAALSAGVGVVVALLLASRKRLQRLATEVITEVEMHDALLLAALALVVVPLLRLAPPTVLGVSPQALARLVLALMMMQALGHVAQRLLGARHGLWVAGLGAGLVSSTAAVAALGARQRGQPRLLEASVAGALASGVATWALALGLTASASPLAAARLAPVCMMGAACTLAASFWAWRRASLSDGQGSLPEKGRMFQPRAALFVALALTLATTLVLLAQERLGAMGVWAVTALAAVVDAHAAIGANATLTSAGKMEHAELVRLALLAIGVNTLSRTVVAAMGGGAPYGLRVGVGLAAGWLAAAATAAWWL